VVVAVVVAGQVLRAVPAEPVVLRSVPQEEREVPGH